MNISNKAISTYSGYNFNSIANFNGTILGAMATGIYELSGANDNGTDIDAVLKTGTMDFGERAIKHIRDLWLTFRSTGKLRIKVWINEDTSTEIHKDTSITGTAMAEERLKIPRGLRGRFFTIEINNIDGVDFDIDSLSMLVESLVRKIR
ncbi:MAG: hypothetical protein EHM49_05235 [Deltaproteobacteria bacterium]|nr:MAG: hypothetical protein EHM49_05235 [Deltaproteobacteria bacterium]